MAHSPNSLPATRAAATLLLVFAACVFVIAKSQEQTHWAWGYARAFAEAAMVGGLADWFAVTALFRRPFGLPIPHTAIVPRSQGRIADALGLFIVENFLAPDLVRERVARQDLAAGLAAWLMDERQAARMADGVAAAIPALLDMGEDRRLQEFLRGAVLSELQKVRLAPVVGSALQVLAERGRHQALFDLAVREAYRALREHEVFIRDKVRQNTSWLWRLAGMDSRAADSIIHAVAQALREIAADPDHPVRRRAANIIGQIALDMKYSETLQAQLESWKEELLSHDAISGFIDDLGRQAKAALRQAADQPEGPLRRGLRDGIVKIGQAMADDPDVRQALNERLRALVVELAGRHGPDVAKLVSETIRSWDARTVVAKLEQNVGADLQYIRISGTLIGGAVGVLLHAISHFIWPV